MSVARAQMDGINGLLFKALHTAFFAVLFFLFNGTMFSFYLFDIGLASLWFLSVGRCRKPSPLSKTEVYKSRVKLSDIDVFAVVNNSKYFKIAERARFDLCGKKKILSRVFKAGHSPVLAGAIARFRRSLRPFQKYYVESKVVYYDEKYVYILQSIKDSKSHNLYFIMMCRVAFVGKDGVGRPADMFGTSADLAEINRSNGEPRGAEPKDEPGQVDGDSCPLSVWRRVRSRGAGPLAVALAAEADAAVARLGSEKQNG